MWRLARICPFFLSKCLLGQVALIILETFLLMVKHGVEEVKRLFLAKYPTFVRG